MLVKTRDCGSLSIANASNDSRFCNVVVLVWHRILFVVPYSKSYV